MTIPSTPKFILTLFRKLSSSGVCNAVLLLQLQDHVSSQFQSAPTSTSMKPHALFWSFILHEVDMDHISLPWLSLSRNKPRYLRKDSSLDSQMLLRSFHGSEWRFGNRSIRDRSCTYSTRGCWRGRREWVDYLHFLVFRKCSMCYTKCKF